jgi:hypothetical protein
VPNARPKFTGPFLGLNTTLKPRELGPAWAVDAQNVILGDGRVRPAWPFGLWGGENPEAAWPPMRWVEGHHPSHVGNAIHWHSPVVGEIFVYQVWAVSEDGQTYAPGYYAVHPDGRVVHLISWAPASGPACYVPAYGRLYIYDGSSFPIRTDGTPENTVFTGMPAPVLGTYEGYLGDTPSADAILEPGDYEYAVTWYDQADDVESNPLNLGRFTVRSLQEEYRFVVSDLGNAGAGWHSTHLRLYRRDHHVGNPYFLLRWTRPRTDIGSTRLYFDPYGFRGTPTPPEGDEVNGPFAPSKNGLPPAATVACLYKDRMFTNYEHIASARSDVRNDYLYYSAFGHPDHVDPDDFEVLGGDAQTGVYGMGEVGHQLVLIKPKSIWLLSGTIGGSTNATIATGAKAPFSTHTLTRSKSAVGCANRGGGNGAIIVGDPELIHFNSEDGLYSFDGVTENNVAKNVRDTWRRFAKQGELRDGEKNQRISYAVDTLNKILFIANGDQPYGDPEVLAYHYGRDRVQAGGGVGAWSYLRPTGRRWRYHTVATTLGDIETPGNREPAYYYAPLAIVCSDGKIRLGNDRSTTLATQAFRYETPPLRPLEGGKAHIYQITWLHDRIHVVPDDGFVRDWAFGFRVVRDETFELRTRSLKWATEQHQGVRRESQEISLLVQSPGGPGETLYWHPDYGLAGWILEFEPAGGF